MPTDTTFLGLKIYNSTTDGSSLFSTFRADQAGVSTTSNMNLIDTFASQSSGSIVALQGRKAIVSVPALYVSANYYEANSLSEITSYSTNQVISLSLDTESDGTVTLNINSLGTKSLNKTDLNGSLVNLTGSDLKKNREYLFRYNGTAWVWINGSSADQISINGTENNLVMVSGCAVLIDSGLQTSGSKLLAGSIQLGDGVVSSSGSLVAKLGDGLTFDSGSIILDDSGVTSGSYNKVEVDDYGRVISGSIIDDLVGINFIIGDGINEISSGSSIAYLEMPTSMVITEARLFADVSGSIVLDIWKDSYNNFPPTDDDSITASAPPTLAGAQKSEDNTLSGWTTLISEGDILAINVDSATTVKQVTLSLTGRRGG